MAYIGIDPGVGGAVAILDGERLEIFDTPKFKGKNGRPDYDIKKMVDILRPHANTKTVLVLELVHSMPGQGVSSSFGFGRGRGLWEGIAEALGYNLILVTPQTWKKDWPDLIVPRISKDSKPRTAKEKQAVKARAKERARELAAQLFPDHRKSFELVKSDGRAEAALIARYASVHFEGFSNA